MALQDYEDWIRRVYSDYLFTILTDTPESYSGAGGYSVVVNDTETGLDFVDLPVDNHSARHEEGGADEVTGITGKLNNHSARHENGGADEISVAGLSGVLSDKQDPQAHGSRHKDGNSDELDAADLAGAAGAADQVLTTDGAAAYWGDAPGGVTSARDLPTSTGSSSGTVGPYTHLQITLNAYSLFPMLYASLSAVRVYAHATEGNADQPRFDFYNGGGNSCTYAAKWRYFT